jgi:hypothetical protein
MVLLGGFLQDVSDPGPEFQVRIGSAGARDKAIKFCPAHLRELAQAFHSQTLASVLLALDRLVDRPFPVRAYSSRCRAARFTAAKPR